MESLTTYFSQGALILVVILLVWSLILSYKERSRKLTSRSRLAELRKKVEALPEETDEEKTKKSDMHRELHLEYLDNILGEIEKVASAVAKKAPAEKKSKRKKK